MNKKEFIEIKKNSFKEINSKLLLEIYIQKCSQFNRLESVCKNSKYTVDKRAFWEQLNELKEIRDFIKEEILKRMKK